MFNVGDEISSAEEFEQCPVGTVVFSEQDGWGILGNYKLVHEFGNEMSGYTTTWSYPSRIVYVGEGQ